MVEYRSFPLVLKTDGTQPIGIAESSAIGTLYISSLVVSTIYASDYQNIAAGFEFTGIYTVTSVGSGTPIVDNSDPNNPKFRAFSVTTDGFVTINPHPGPNPGLDIQFGSNALSPVRGGTGYNLPGGEGEIPAWNAVGQLEPRPGFTINGTILDIPGEYHINGSQINLNNLNNVNVGISPDINDVLTWDGSVWTNLPPLTGAGTTISLPTSPGRVLISVDSTSVGSVSWFNILTGTGVVNVCSVCAVGNVCAATFTEGGQALSVKYLTKAVADTYYQPTGNYQPCDVLLSDISDQGYVNLGTGQVDGTLPVVRGGTGLTLLTTTGAILYALDSTAVSLTPSPQSNKYLKWNGTAYIWDVPTGGTGTNIPNQPGRIPYIIDTTSLGSESWFNILTGTGTVNVCSVCAVANVCAATFSEGGQTLSSKYLTITNAATTYLTKATFDSFTGTTLKELAYKDRIDLGTTSVTGTLTVSRGGTGLTTLTADTFLIGNGTSISFIPTGSFETTAHANLTYLTKSEFTTFTGTTLGDLAYSDQVNLATTSVTGTLSVSRGGTGSTTLGGGYGILYAENGGTSISQGGYFNGTTLLLASPGQSIGSVTVYAGALEATSIDLKSQLNHNLKINLATTSVTGSLNVENGGTGQTALTAGSFVVGNGTTAVSLIPTGSFETTSYSRANFATIASLNSYVLTSTYSTFTGTLGELAFIDQVNLATTSVTGTLTVSRGGTGLTSLTPTGILYAANSTTITQTPAPTTNNYLKWDGSQFTWDIPAGGSTSPVGPEGAIQYKSGSNTFTGVNSFIFNQASSLLATNSVSAGVFYAAGTGQIKTPKSNYVYYGSPGSTTYNGVTYPKGYVTQDQNGEFWFSSNAFITGATQPGPSSTLFVRRVCVGGTTTNNVGVVFGRFTTNPGIGPGLDPVDLDPPEFLTLTGTANYLTYMDSGGTLSYASSMSVYKKNGSLSASPDTLQINGALITENFSSTVDATIGNATIGNDLVVLGNGQILGTLEAGTVSATTYLNLPSSTITWSNATNAERVRRYVKNMTGSTIPKGRAVTITGATGDNSLISPLSSVNNHIPEAIGLSNHVFGLTETEIAHDSFGYIITEGMLSGTGGGVNALDTSLFAAGDILYVSSNGLLSNSRPPAPYEAHPIGYVVRSNANVGSIYVKIETVPEINDIVGFNLASSLINGDLITYDLTTSTFVNTQSINVSGLIKGGSLSATNLSATNARITSLSATTLSATTYLNLPSTALSSLSDTLITAPALSSVLKWNGSKWVPATDQTGGGGGSPAGVQYDIQVNDGAGGFYADSTFQYDYDAAKVIIAPNTLQVDAVATFNNSTDFTQPVTFTTIKGTSVSSTTVSATTYLNLPSGVATWNANKLQGVTVTSTTPVATQHLEYDGTSWKPEWNSVSTINSTVTLTNTCDEKLFVSSSGSKVTITLPDPTTCAGKEIQIIKADPSGMPVYVSAATLQSPGNLIAMRIPRDMVQVISDGTNWYIQHNNSSYGGSHEVGTYDVEFEDFIWGSTESGEVGIRNWSFTNGTVTVVNNTGADGTGRGVINRQSGTTANQVASMYPSNAGTNTTNFANEILDFKIRQYPTSITAYKIRFGMFSDMTADPPASGIYFECSSGQSNYQAITRNGAVETKTDTAVAVDAAAFSTFRIFRRSDSAIEFYINDNIVATNTANIPSQHAVTFGYQSIPTTTTAKGSNIDYISVAIVDTTQRY